MTSAWGTSILGEGGVAGGDGKRPGDLPFGELLGQHDADVGGAGPVRGETA